MTAPVLTASAPAWPAPDRHRPRADVVPQVAWGVMAVGGVLAVGLWWRDTGQITGLGPWLTNAGRLTGLAAGYAVAVVLALMARLPVLERGLGADRLARWHAAGGRYVVSLAVAHTLLIIWGYAWEGGASVVATTGQLLTQYAGVGAATIGLGLLVLVGVVSARAARRRLPYEVWHAIHLTTYLAIGLSVEHEVATGADFLGPDARLARLAWIGLYVVVGALLVWYRLVVPLAGAWRRQLRVIEVRRESADVVSVYVTGRDLGSLRAEPGQFFRWRFLTGGLWWAANPYSLSAAPQPDWWRITVKMVGGHSRALLGLRPGTPVLAEGPYGAFTARRRTRRKALLVAGGVGIAPLRALFETLPGAPGEVDLIYRTNTPAEVVLRGELDWIAAQRGARVWYLAGPPGQGAHAMLGPAHLRSLVPDLAERDVYLCGPAPMMAATTAALLGAGVDRHQIHTEEFTY